MNHNYVLSRQAFEEALRNDQIAEDEAARLQAIADRKRKEQEHLDDLAEEARNNFGGCA